MNDYERVARIIQHLDDHFTTQPDLADLARRADLSPTHFHRLFSRWAGVTPKDFLQCLTAAHARELLRRGESVLDAALSSGLSGPGRLHDLTVMLEAATPGEVKSGGAGCVIRYGFASTPFGPWLTGQTERGVCHVAFVDAPDAALTELHAAWPAATLDRDDAASASLANAVFAPTPDKLGSSPRPLRLLVRGTAFQIQVWRALLRLPPGTLTTYGKLARTVGAPGAARAVGSAVGANSLALLIPCHRVIRETGIIGDYRWGSERKKCLIAWESSRTGAVTAPEVQRSLR